jgi:vancomycin permeability regulator SanA
MAQTADRKKTEESHQQETKKPKNKKKSFKSRLIIFLLLLLLLILSPILLAHFITEAQNSRIYTEVQQVPSRPVAMIFGAGLNPDGSPSLMLADRVEAGVALYKQGKVKQLMMTGDGIGNNEVKAMRLYAIQKGVPASAIILDAGGMRTYDSCWRAANNFGITEAILVTQAYHLPRALYLCNSLGVDAVGLKAGLESYPHQEYYNSREFLAVIGAWVDINISKPKPEVEK